MDGKISFTALFCQEKTLVSSELTVVVEVNRQVPQPQAPSLPAGCPLGPGALQCPPPTQAVACAMSRCTLLWLLPASPPSRKKLRPQRASKSPGCQRESEGCHLPGPEAPSRERGPRRVSPNDRPQSQEEEEAEAVASVWGNLAAAGDQRAEVALRSGQGAQNSRRPPGCPGGRGRQVARSGGRRAEPRARQRAPTLPVLGANIWLSLQGLQHSMGRCLCVVCIGH